MPLCIAAYVRYVRAEMEWKRNEARQDCSEKSLCNPWLNYSFLPAAASEYQSTHHRQSRKSDGHRDENAVRSPSQRHAQDVSERNLPQPKHKQIDDRRRPRIAGPIKRLTQHHAVRVKQEPIGYGSQAVDSVLSNVRIVRVETDDLWGKQNEKKSHNPEEDHVVETGFPNCTLSALRILCTERLANHRRSRVCHSPRRQ